MNSSVVSGVLAAACVLAVGSSTGAQDKSWKGEQVFYTKPAEEITFGDFIDGKQVDYSFSGIMPIIVREERDGQIRIHDGQRERLGGQSTVCAGKQCAGFFYPPRSSQSCRRLAAVYARRRLAPQ